MSWNAEHRIDEQPADSTVKMLDEIRTDQEERWQVSADYYRAALREIAIMRMGILAIFVLKAAEWCLIGR